MMVDGPPVAVSLCQLAADPAAYAERTVSIRARVIRTPGGGARLLDADRPNDEACAVSVQEFPVDLKGQPGHQDRDEATVTASVALVRRVDFGRVIVSYSLREVGLVRWGR
jgi:hypothetical protein